jgi:hypothetical protein
MFPFEKKYFDSLPLKEVLRAIHEFISPFIVYSQPFNLVYK